jgi:thioredoxin-dependent peroxiredoxin
MLAVGERAPEFSLPDSNGKDRSLTSLLNKGSLILYFYPADFTPGCTKEACSIRDLHSDIASVGLTVVGVSPQSPESHTRFRDKYNLPFLLLSDEKKAVIKMFGVDGPLGFGVRRTTFLIDRNRVVRDAVLADFRIGEHEAFIQKSIAIAEGGGR